MILTIKCKDKTFKGLKNIMEATGSPSLSDAIRRATQTYNYLIECAEKGYKFKLQKNWHEVEITIPRAEKKNEPIHI